MLTTRYRGLFGITAIMAVSVAIGYGGFRFFETQRSIRTAEERLASFLIPPITYDGDTYTFRDGQIVEPISYSDRIHVLRIAQFVTSHRTDPIFAFEGLRTDEFAENISRSKDALDEVLPFFDDTIAEMFRASLYPNDFLAHVANLEASRQSMLATPSRETIDEYQSMLQATIDAYIGDIEALTGLIYVADPDGTQKYGFFDGVTDRDTVIGALRAHASSARAQYEKARKRYKCFMTGICEGDNEATLQYTVGRPPIATTTLNAAAHTNAEVLYQLNQAFHTSLWSQSSASMPTTTTEMLLLADLRCYPGSEEILFGEFKTPFLPAHASKFEPLNDVFFYDTEILNSGPYFAWLKNKGIRYQHHTSNAPYMCLESGETQNRLSRMQYIRDSVRSHPLFDVRGNSDVAPEALPPDVITQLRTAEETIREADTLSELDVYVYLETIANTLNVYGEMALEDAFENTALPAAHFIQVWNQGAHNLSADLAYIAYLTAQQPFVLIHKEKSPAEFVYPRSYMSILLMSYNTSVIPGTPPSFIKTRDTFVPERYGYTTYRTGVLKSRSVDEIRDLITRSNIFTTTFNETENPLPTTP